MSSSGTAPSWTSGWRRRAGSMLRSNMAGGASDEHLKQQKIETHLACNVCTKIPYPGSESMIPLMIAEQDRGATDFDAKIYDYLYHMNGMPSELVGAACQIDKETAAKTKERCSRHAQKLQRELANSKLFQSEPNLPSSAYNGDDHLCDERPITPFDIDEVKVGSLLGMGGFSSVFEVLSFNPSPELSEGLATNEQNTRHELANNLLVSVQSNKHGFYATSNIQCKGRNGRISRYAIKHLRKALVSEPERFERAAVDLVLEAQLLLAMNHPNIITLRGWSIQGVNSFMSGKYNSFFVIIDRLPVLLEHRIFQWRLSIRRYRSRLKIPWCKQKYVAKLDNILFQRLQVARDVAAALEYMHDRRIIYRDLKTTNIGFDVFGQTKIFDFGLARLLPSRNDEAFLMSRVGTKYYMAPEVRKKLPYSLPADVYSYGVTFWEIMSLGSPREVLRKYKDDSNVFMSTGQCPLPFCSCWPMEIRHVIGSSLTIGAVHRPKIGSVRSSIEAILRDLLGNGNTTHPSARGSQQIHLYQAQADGTSVERSTSQASASEFNQKSLSEDSKQQDLLLSRRSTETPHSLQNDHRYVTDKMTSHELMHSRDLSSRELSEDSKHEIVLSDRELGDQTPPQHVLEDTWN